MDTFVSLAICNLLSVLVLPFEEFQNKEKLSLAHFDLLWTFDLVVVNDFFVLLINLDKMQQIRAKSDVVLVFAL